MSRKKVFIILAALLAVDQIVKILVKTNMRINDAISIFSDWFFIRFIENPGAAFGMQIGGQWGKLTLSLFRIALIIGLACYIHQLYRKHAPKGVIVGFIMIMAGAIGNMIDSAFYGLIFSESTSSSVATLFPQGGGYASFLHGHVVDMLYFPLFSGTYPSWLPFVGDQPFLFFAPVFNLADSYISVGLFYIILFQRKYFSK